MEFGETLAQLRRNKNLSQAQLAAQLYDMRAGAGATRYLVTTLLNHCGE